MFLRLADIVDQDLDDDSLPDVTNLSEEEAQKFVGLWAWWRATDKRFLPSEIMNEPSRPMALLLEIDNYFERIVKQLKAQEEDGEQKGDDQSRDTA